MSPGRGYPCFPVGSIITRHYVRSTRLKPRSQETNTCRREQTELIWQVKKLADVAKRTPRWRRASIETLRFLRERALVFYRNCVHEAQSELRAPPVSTKPQAAQRPADLGPALRPRAPQARVAAKSGPGPRGRRSAARVTKPWWMQSFYLCPGRKAWASAR